MFLAVEVFKFFTQDRVPLNAPSSSSVTFQFLVAVCKIFSQFRALQCLPLHSQKTLSKGFSNFSPAPEKCEGCQESECEGARAPKLIHASCPSQGSEAASPFCWPSHRPAFESPRDGRLLSQRRVLDVLRPDGS